MSSVAVLLAWHVLGHIDPASTATAVKDDQERVLVRFTKTPRQEIPGVHSFDEHGDKRFAWTYRSRFEELQARGAPLKLDDGQLQATIDAQMRRLNYRPRALAHDWIENPDHWLSDFRRQDEINQALRHAASTQPDLELETLGTSLQGRKILGLTIPGRGALAKKRMLVMGTQHAREWLSTMACLTLLRDWLDKRRSSSADRPTLTVVPVVNPDGYAYSWEHDRLWRKNRRPTDNKKGEGGVDLNRNWGQSWGDAHGASEHPEDDAYHGEHAFSEPETRAIRDFVQKHKDVAAMLDVHTFGQWVIYPASCKKEVSWGKKDFSMIANQIARRITHTAGAQYSAIGGMDFSYPACGDAADWFAESQRAYAFTLELRPGASAGRSGFIQPPSAIAPTSRDLIAAVEDLRAWVGGEPFAGPVLAAQGGEDPGTEASMCALAPNQEVSVFSLGALCCLGALARKRSQACRISFRAPPARPEASPAKPEDAKAKAPGPRIEFLRK